MHGKPSNWIPKIRAHALDDKSDKVYNYFFTSVVPQSCLWINAFSSDVPSIFPSPFFVQYIAWHAQQMCIFSFLISLAPLFPNN